MRAKFQFRYGDKLAPEVLAALNATGIVPPITADEDGRVVYFTPYSGDLEAVVAVLPPEVRVEVLGAADPHPILELAEAVRAMQRRLDGRNAEPSSYVNNRIDVHVPGNALLAIDEVDVFADLCTDELGELLGKGWRIVAVCPQPDQRRPDYVLGRRLPLED